MCGPICCPTVLFERPARGQRKRPPRRRLPAGTGPAAAQALTVAFVSNCSPGRRRRAASPWRAWTLTNAISSGPESSKLKTILSFQDFLASRVVDTKYISLNSMLSSRILEGGSETNVSSC